MDRREFFRLGNVGLGGFGLAGAASTTARPICARARACILIYLDGGPSRIDLWDMKPDAPVEIRGDFRSIAKSVSGIRVCEHLPLTSLQMHRLAQIRSVRDTETVHDPSVYQMLTGRKHRPASPMGSFRYRPGTPFPPQPSRQCRVRGDRFRSIVMRQGREMPK